jgi:hypothetical protein
MTKRELTDTRLSHSSANTLRSCEQKYVHYKVLGANPDPDYTESDALSVGKAFHYIQEQSRHEKTRLADYIEYCKTSEDIKLPEDKAGLVAGMCKAYWAFHAQSGTKIVDVEYKISTDHVVGYIDAITLDDQGKWYIEDLKCYKGFYPSSVVGLSRDQQLNLYAYHAADIAKTYKLRLRDFGGAGLRIVTKSSAKQKGTEGLRHYSDRLAKLIKIYRVIVPAEDLDPEAAMAEHENLQLIANNLHAQAYEPSRNYGSCLNYFSPCQYWSKCYGKTYTQMVEEVSELAIPWQAQ